MKWERILFVINPVAGRGISDMEIGAVSRRLAREGRKVDLRFTSEEHPASAQVLADGSAYDLIIVAGGDGTLREAAQALLRAGVETPLGFLPTGSTCDIAQTLGISRDLLQASERIMQAEPKRIDVGRVGKEYFVYVCSFGAFTETSWATPRESKQTWGHLAYVLEGAKRLPSLQAHPCRIETEREMFEGKWLFGAMLNTTSLGGIIRIPEPDVRLDDGKLELLLIREPQERLAFAQIASDLLNQRYTHPDIIFRHCREIRLHFEEEVPFTLDGEFGGMHYQLNVQAVKQVLPLVF